MSRICFILVFFFVSIFFSCSKPLVEKELSNFMGVWANENSEMVFTSKYRMLLTKRKGTYMATLYKIVPTDSEIKLKAVAGVNANPLEKRMDIFARRISDNEWLIDAQKNNDFDAYETEIESTLLGKERIFYNDELLCEYLPKENKMVVFDSGEADTLELVEKLSLATATNSIDATKANVGICLIEWQLGTFVKTTSHYESLTVNTNKYSFHFGFGLVNGEQSVYARGATIDAANKGMAYFQTFRIMKSPMELSLWKTDNHFKKMNLPQKISVVHLTHPNYEQISEGTYWYLYSFGKQWIKLKDKNDRQMLIEKPRTDVISEEEYFSYISSETH